HVKKVLRHVDHTLQRRHRNGLPFLGLKRAAQNLEFGLVLRHQTCKKMSVKTIQIIHGIANRESGMEIKQQVHIPKRPGKIQQGHALSSKCRKLHAEVDAYRRRTYPALRSHYNNQLIQRWPVL